MYEILPYSKNKAKELNVQIEPSTRKNKKIKVVEPDGSVFHIGDARYMDYPTYKMVDPKKADERRLAYWIRHKKDSGKAGFYAKSLLW
jgi:hypothetical protein